MVGIATAKKEKEKTAKKLIERGFQTDGFRGVEDVYQRYGIDYVKFTKKVERVSSEDQKVTPEYGFDEGKSEISIMLGENVSGPNRIWATAAIELDGVDSMGKYYDGTDDSIGVSYNEDHWSAVGDTYLTIDHPSDVEEDGEISWYSQSLENGGLAAEVELPIGRYVRGTAYPPDWTRATLMTELRNLDGVAGNIFGSYVHNGGSGNIASVSGGAGPLSVELSGLFSKTNFDIAKPGDPDKVM